MKRLIIGPGSMIIYSFIGALKYLKEFGHLEDLEEISCSSSGSMVGFFYILTKGDVDRMLSLSIDSPLVDLAKPEIKCLLDKFGLIDADRFEKYMSKVAQKLVGNDPTFKELFEMNPIKLHVPTYDLVTNKTIYMSVDTTPDMKVSHAVRRSIAIPIIMTPVNARYIDGSIAEFSPCTPFLGKCDVFEIRFRYAPKPKNRARTLFQYFYDVIMAFVSNRFEYMQFPRLDISIEDVEIFNFSMKLEQKLELYRIGYMQAYARLQGCNRNDPSSCSSDSKSLACSHECTHDQEPQSEDQHHLEVDVTGENFGSFESPSPKPQETNQSDLDTFSEISHSDWGQ